MKKFYYGSFLCGILIAVLAVLYNNIETSVPFVNAQTNCINPPVLSRAIRWERGANVAVKIHSAFTLEERSSIVAAFEDWNRERISTCANVTFSGFEVLDTRPTPQTNVHWVAYDPTPDPGFPGQT
jgi:hypothetical protein